MEKRMLLQCFLFLFVLVNVTVCEIVEYEIEIDDNIEVIMLKNKLYFKKYESVLKSRGLEKVGSEPGPEPESNAEMWINIAIIFILTILSCITSGLTVGYMSIDDLMLELKSMNGTDTEKYHASRILPVVKDRHRLLVTLLIWMAGSMESMPIFLGKLVNELNAVIIAVALVLFIGYIIPQSVCTGPDQIRIAAAFSTFTRILIIITFPLGYPMGKALDCILGVHSKSRYINDNLKALIELHTIQELKKHHIIKGDAKKIDLENEVEKESDGELFVDKKNNMGLSDNQANIIISAIESGKLKAKDILVPMNKAYMLNYNETFDKLKLMELLGKGYSRIPLYKDNDVNHLFGILRVKKLIGTRFRFEEKQTLKEFLSAIKVKISSPLIVNPETTLIELLRMFKKGRSHMAFVTEKATLFKSMIGQDDNDSLKDGIRHSGKFEKEEVVNVLGLVTLEDVLEKMIKHEILDEEDYRRLKYMEETYRRNSRVSRFSRMIANKYVTDVVAESLTKENLLRRSAHEKQVIRSSIFSVNKRTTSGVGFQVGGFSYASGNKIGSNEEQDTLKQALIAKKNVNTKKH